uniref:Large ribosomal subunit protein uL11m n=1 Tax=Jakoba bahamiensis TaxID=221721 RepID=M4Q9U7_9EUKA|nr:ribosomal protein L11 [Jakoba bahamiensis]AGH24141.1 ribosomal protein L11 [Jakoba bahamiensis]
MKKIIDTLRLEIEAGKANPSPPVGPALGLRGVNIMAFCKEFNALTKDYQTGIKLPTVISIYEDKSFTFVIKNPSTSFCIKKGFNTNKGSENHLKQTEISDKLLYLIATIKQNDYNLTRISLKSLYKSIYGTAKSMGFTLKKGNNL